MNKESSKLVKQDYLWAKKKIALYSLPWECIRHNNTANVRSSSFDLVQESTKFNEKDLQESHPTYCVHFVKVRSFGLYI